MSSGQKHEEAATGGAAEITLLYLYLIAVFLKSQKTVLSVIGSTGQN